MAPYCPLWIPLDDYGSLLLPMAIGWLCIASNDSLCFPMDSQYVPLAPYGSLWIHGFVLLSKAS